MKITCKSCKKKKETNTNSMKRLIAKFGSKEEVIDKYICRDCRKEKNVRADGKPKPVKGTRKKRALKGFGKTEDGQVILPEWMSKPIKRELPPLTPDEMAKDNVCWRPDIWVANGRACNDCPHYQVSCGCKNTKWLTEKELAMGNQSPRSKKTKKIKKTKKKTKKTKRLRK